MSEQIEKTNCTICNKEILISTFKRNVGKCGRCAKLSASEIAKKKARGIGGIILTVMGYLFLWIVPIASLYALLIVIKDPWVIRYQPGVIPMILVGSVIGFRLLMKR